MCYSRLKNVACPAGQEDGNEAGMREICMDVADQLEAVASSGEDYEDEAPEHTPAPQRFVAAVQAAVQTAEAMGLSSGQDDPLRYFTLASALQAETGPAFHSLSAFLQQAVHVSFSTLMFILL